MLDKYGTREANGYSLVRRGPYMSWNRKRVGGKSGSESIEMVWPRRGY